MELTEKQIEDFPYDLMGTCKSIEEVFHNQFNVDLSEISSQQEYNLFEAIDRVTFNCNTCGWWDEMGCGEDNDGEWICSSCVESEDD